jgi:cyclophilin family peptidyl-prolyl cis-trans isomerase
MEITKEIKERLGYLRKQIQEECISYGEILELQGLARYIDPSDFELLQWAGYSDDDKKGVDEISGYYLDKMFKKVVKEYGIKYGDMTMDMHGELLEIQEDLHELLTRFIKHNLN